MPSCSNYAWNNNSMIRAISRKRLPNTDSGGRSLCTKGPMTVWTLVITYPHTLFFPSCRFADSVQHARRNADL